MTFTLDTSGFVQFRDSHGELMTYRWSDLGPFTQGYVEALLSGWIKGSEVADESDDVFGLAFSDLAPETLARIMEDCGKRQERSAHMSGIDPREHGSAFWRARQSSGNPNWRPLTPYLRDDGKVCLTPTQDRVEHG